MTLLLYITVCLSLMLSKLMSVIGYNTRQYHKSISTLLGSHLHFAFELHQTTTGDDCGSSELFSHSALQKLKIKKQNHESQSRW